MPVREAAQRPGRRGVLRHRPVPLRSLAPPAGRLRDELRATTRRWTAVVVEGIRCRFDDQFSLTAPAWPPTTSGCGFPNSVATSPANPSHANPLGPASARNRRGKDELPRVANSSGLYRKTTFHLRNRRRFDAPGIILKHVLLEDITRISCQTSYANGTNRVRDRNLLRLPICKDFQPHPDGIPITLTRNIYSNGSTFESA